VVLEVSAIILLGGAAISGIVYLLSQYQSLCNFDLELTVVYTFNHLVSIIQPLERILQFKHLLFGGSDVPNQLASRVARLAPKYGILRLHIRCRPSPVGHDWPLLGDVKLQTK
jgi:hypothetical protein